MAPKKRQVKTEAQASEPFDAASLPTPALESEDLRMSYRIARGEQGVLTFEPYKSLLLPHWRFRTVSIARTSSSNLYDAFVHYVRAGDLVGADMARKFIQMGMTRAKRYANHKGGRKYDKSEREMAMEVTGEDGKVRERKELPKSEGHEGMQEKLEASEVFKGVWRRCTGDEEYLTLKKEFLAEQKVWDGAQKKGLKKEEEVKTEVEVKEEQVDAG